MWDFDAHFSSAVCLDLFYFPELDVEGYDGLENPSERIAEDGPGFSQFFEFCSDAFFEVDLEPVVVEFYLEVRFVKGHDDGRVGHCAQLQSSFWAMMYIGVAQKPPLPTRTGFHISNGRVRTRSFFRSRFLSRTESGLFSGRKGRDMGESRISRGWDR